MRTPFLNPYPMPTANGLSLEFERREEGMAVKVTQPRWAGIIAEEVYWDGHVLVDGDVRVAPEGGLFIQQGTRVRFAGADGLEGGRDPELIELEIQGGFDIRISGRDESAGKAVFEAQSPGARWYGLLLDPVASRRVNIPIDDLC